MEKSTSLGNLAKALAAFQGKVGKIKKDAKNPFFKSKYASLSNIIDAIQGPLSEAGLALSQLPDGDESLTTILIHAESGEFIQSSYSIHAVKKDPQGIGSAITYARRYAIGAVLGLNIDDDDDGNASTGNGQQQAFNGQMHRTPQQRDSADSILALTNIRTVDDLTAFITSQPEHVRKDAQFQAACKDRQKEIKKDTQSVAA